MNMLGSLYYSDEVGLSEEHIAGFLTNSLKGQELVKKIDDIKNN